ncbi:MAG: LarC family nickel insertion protein [bacterium]
MKIAYVNLSAGASGDMIVGSLVNAGFSNILLHKAVKKLKLKKTKLAITRTERNHLPCISVKVSGTDRLSPRDMRFRISRASFSNTIKTRSLGMLKTLIEAEAQAHSVNPHSVHFHQLSDPDTIIDIVCASAGIEFFNPDKIMASPIHAGFISPAAAYILKKIKAKIYTDSALYNQELITPTGAAILAGFNITFAPFPVMKIASVGFGAGEKIFPAHINLLQLVVGHSDTVSGSDNDEVISIETNIDDMDPRVYPYVMKKLLAKGAYDVWYTPIHMKKGRPGITLSVLCSKHNFSSMKSILFKETTTLGIRFIRMQRYCLPRKRSGIKKCGEYNGKLKKTVEYEDGVRLAEHTKIPLHEVLKHG